MKIFSFILAAIWLALLLSVQYIPWCVQCPAYLVVSYLICGMINLWHARDDFGYKEPVYEYKLTKLGTLFEILAWPYVLLKNF